MPRYGASDTYTDNVNFSYYLEENARNLDEQLNGSFVSYVSASALDSGSPINYTHGLGKLIIVINAGSDLSGTITVTGDSVNRNTGAVTAGDTDTITVDALTTDDSDSDAEGNTRHSFTGAYITSKWFFGAVALSTADLTLTDVDVYGISFEQVNDSPNLTLQTFNCSLYCTNTAGWFYAYLYSVVVTGDKVDITRESTLALTVGDSEADKAYRLRKGSIGKSLDGSKDGFWSELFFGPDVQKYFRDISIDIWFDISKNT